MLGFWISDSLSAQGWEGAASIIAVGLTWQVSLGRNVKDPDSYQARGSVLTDNRICY